MLEVSPNEMCHVLQVGFDAGDGVNYFALPASRTPEIINVRSMSNVNMPGLFMFRVDSAGIKQGGCSTNGKVSKFSGRVFQDNRHTYGHKLCSSSHRLVPLFV